VTRLALIRVPVAQLALLLALLAALALPATGRAATQATALRFSPTEQSVLRRINDYRAAHGLNRLVWDQAIGRMGRRHACDMRAAGALSHQPLGRLTKRLVHWTHYGENVGRATTIPLVWRAFLGSPTHLENIVHDWGRRGRMGAGVRRGADGEYWITMSFTTGDPLTTLGPRADTC
jgi:uncharacterized protein YkwD